MRRSLAVRPAWTRSVSASVPKLKRYRIEAMGSGVACETTTSSGFSIRSDIPKLAGGTNAAPEPVYLLLAALVGCETATAMFVARKLKLSITSVRFELSAERDERGALSLPIDIDPAEPARLRSIVGTAFVSSPQPLSEEQLSMLGRQTHRRCPVANMIASSGTELHIAFSTEVRQDERRYHCFSFTLLTYTILIPTLIKLSTLSRCAGGWAGRTSRGPSGGWRGAEPISACTAARRASQRPEEQQRCRLGAQLQGDLYLCTAPRDLG
jgi:putative redox protein